jgi:hypothetical protein
MRRFTHSLVVIRCKTSVDGPVASDPSGTSGLMNVLIQSRIPTSSRVIYALTINYALWI